MHPLFFKHHHDSNKIMWRCGEDKHVVSWIGSGGRCIRYKIQTQGSKTPIIQTAFVDGLKDDHLFAFVCLFIKGKPRRLSVHMPFQMTISLFFMSISMSRVPIVCENQSNQMTAIARIHQNVNMIKRVRHWHHCMWYSCSGYEVCEWV